MIVRASGLPIVPPQNATRTAVPAGGGDRYSPSEAGDPAPAKAADVRGAALARAPADPLPLPHDLASDTAYNRINLPWFHFGVDFGVTAWGDLGIRNNPDVGPTLDRLKRHGVEDVITWTIPDGRTIRFAPDGTPSGLAPGFTEDLYAWLDHLSQRDMSAELVLIDGNTWFLPAAESNGVKMRGHGDVVKDPTGRKQAAFDRNVLKPMLDTIKGWQAANPGRPLPVSGISLGNELEYGLDRDPEKNIPSMFYMTAFAKDRAAFIRANLPGVPLTVGCAKPDDLFEHWLFAGLDYFTFHHYGSESLTDMADRLPWPGLQHRKVHLGEYPGTKHGRATDPADYTDAVAGNRGPHHRRRTQDRFLTSAAVWSSQTIDSASPRDPDAHMARVQRWFNEGFAASEA